VFLAGLHRAEHTIAERLLRLAHGALPWPRIDPDKALPWVEGRIGLALADSQVAAIRLALKSKVLVMTGVRASENDHRQSHSAHSGGQGLVKGREALLKSSLGCSVHRDCLCALD
jgi:hypothetical protein